MIKTIPLWKMAMATKGKIIGIVILAFLPVFIVAGAWMFLDGLQSGQYRQAAMGALGFIFFGAGGVLFIPATKYIPGKTFKLYRNKKFITQKAVNYGYGICVLIFAGLAALAPEDAIKSIGYGLAAIYGLYIFSKSLKFHEDVDFSTNEYLATALGFPAGEKILVSYQNFDSDDIKTGSNAFAATATKLVVASFDGQSWVKLSRELSQISGIGICGNESQSYFVKLQFSDGTDVLLCIGLYEKLTSNPVLVVRKLLETIDASLLSGSGAPQPAQRRRVVVHSGTPASISKDTAPEAEMAPMRNIEVAPAVLAAIQNAEEVVPGRRLEL